MSQLPQAGVLNNKLLNQQPGQPPAPNVGSMSPTAGPISAAMGLGGSSSTGSGAGNFTSGLSGVPTPHMQTLPTFNPLSITNMLGHYQNQANDANAQRYQQALGVMGQGQDSTNALYGQARDDISGIGQQQLGRIDLNLQNQLGGVDQNSISRGLGNSTIRDTMKFLPEREAADAQQGVAEMQSRLYSGLDTQQAASQTGYANSIAGLIGSRNDIAPEIGQFAGLMQGAAAGNFGKFPQRSGSTTSYPPMTGGTSGGPGSPAAQNAANQQAYQQGSATNWGVGPGSGGASPAGGGSPGTGGTYGDAMGMQYLSGDFGAGGGGSSGSDFGDNTGFTAAGNPYTTDPTTGLSSGPNFRELPPSTQPSGGPISSAMGTDLTGQNAQQGLPITVSPDDARYYSELWGANWKGMIDQGGGVTVA